MTACPICFTEFQPRTHIQETCSSRCAQFNRVRKDTAKRRVEAAMKGPDRKKHFTITDTLPRDIDLLWVQLDPKEMDEALEDHALPECARLTYGGVAYEVFDSLAGNGRIYQRLQGDNGKVIMSKAERRICQ